MRTDRLLRKALLTPFYRRGRRGSQTRESRTGSAQINRSLDSLCVLCETSAASAVKEAVGSASVGDDVGSRLGSREWRRQRLDRRRRLLAEQIVGVVEQQRPPQD